MIKQLVLSTVMVGLAIYFLSQNQYPHEDLSKMNQFLEFRKKYNKVSMTPRELEYRYNVFLDNLKYIEKQNSMNLSYSVGINQFSDLTWEEFQKGYLMDSFTNEDKKVLEKIP